MYIYGGASFLDGETVTLQDLVMLDLESYDWYTYWYAGLTPGPRLKHTIVAIDHRIALFGAGRTLEDKTVFYILDTTFLPPFARADLLEVPNLGGLPTAEDLALEMDMEDGMVDNDISTKDSPQDSDGHFTDSDSQPRKTQKASTRALERGTEEVFSKDYRDSAFSLATEVTAIRQVKDPSSRPIS